ncbi:hypothetical protein ACJMK2_041372 [Sinanodonta woodiana]|uniref:ADP-ribosylglycohydrolase n=1 Tax=Sinanodonta woodiana TaxID=1069815 RepID=A0ABD3W599_SINWO
MYWMASHLFHYDRDTQRGIRDEKPHLLDRCRKAPAAARTHRRNDNCNNYERTKTYVCLPTKNFDRTYLDTTMPIHGSSKHLSRWEVEELKWQQQKREIHGHKVAAPMYGRQKRALDTGEDGISKKIKATIYGNCVGDAIGLLTEFMTEAEARELYGYKDLYLEDKRNDCHRSRWKTGEWTDDSDQMILIMRSLIQNRGKVNVEDFAKKLTDWADFGFPELRDSGGLGIGHTTYSIIQQRDFLHNPHKAAEDVWLQSGRTIAPNGGVMRTSILGIHEWWDLDKVERNTIQICLTTHRDPRCQASAVAVSTAIALMLQGEYFVPTIISKCLERADRVLKDNYHKYELYKALYCENLHELRLDEEGKIGYTFKCLGAGFWALKQNDFRKALTEIVLNGGDADTNGAVAGALLGCKLGTKDDIHQPWLLGLRNKSWLDVQIDQYVRY